MGRTPHHVVQVVFDTESSPPVPLGTYLGVDEASVIYETSNGFKCAPDDCVTVVSVAVPA